MERMRVWGLVAALIAAGCGSTPPVPARAVELNRLAVVALDEGDLVMAEARLSLALEFSPRFVEALVNLGLVELSRGNHERAEALLRRARRLNEHVPHPHHGLGVLAHRRQQVSEAAAHYREALRIDPAFAPSRANLGRLLFDAGAVEEAKAQFQKLVEAAPADGRGHAGLIEALLRLDRRADAARAMARASEQAPGAAPVRLLLARRALDDGRVEEARDALRKLADEHHEVTASARAWLAVAELARGDAAAAVAQADRALALDRHEPVATYAMAAALEAQGDPSAGAWRRRVQETTPGVGPGAWRR